MPEGTVWDVSEAGATIRRAEVSEASQRSWLTVQSCVIKETGLEVNTEKTTYIEQNER
jgi:hypothetical protein